MTDSPELDREGFLENPADWDQAVAKAIAERENIALSPAHWEVIHCLRDFYRRYEMAPANRLFVKVVREALGEERGNSIHLMQHFGGTPAKTACKIAGLPKPPGCL